MSEPKVLALNVVVAQAMLDEFRTGTDEDRIQLVSMLAGGVLTPRLWVLLHQLTGTKPTPAPRPEDLPVQDNELVSAAFYAALLVLARVPTWAKDDPVRVANIISGAMRQWLDSGMKVDNWVWAITSKEANLDNLPQPDEGDK